MKNKKIIIGSRASKLALIYAGRVKSEIMNHRITQNIEEIKIKSITTTGDIVQDIRLSDHGGKGLFCKKIEEELLDGKIDIAAHALKDMPSFETDSLLTACYLKRNDPREILISKNNKKLKDLLPNSIVGTSSFRREFQLKKM
jgi:hydroxymethylbilane synthase